MPGHYSEPDLATRCTQALATRLALGGVPLKHAASIAETARAYWATQLQARDGTDLWLACCPLDDDDPSGRWEVHVGATTDAEPVVVPGVRLISLREICWAVLANQCTIETTGAGHA